MIGNESNDTWNPLENPAGETAEKPLAKQLSTNEWRILRELRAGNPLRQVEIDRLVSLKLAERDAAGSPVLTTLGRNVSAHDPG